MYCSFLSVSFYRNNECLDEYASGVLVHTSDIIFLFSCFLFSFYPLSKCNRKQISSNTARFVNKETFTNLVFFVIFILFQWSRLDIVECRQNYFVSLEGFEITSFWCIFLCYVVKLVFSLDKNRHFCSYYCYHSHIIIIIIFRGF